MKRNPLIAFILIQSTKLAIRKHDIKSVWVIGRTGTVVTSELIEGLLKKQAPVRRQILREKTPYTVLFSYLGIEDRVYSIRSWMQIIWKVFLQLLLGKRAPSWVIVQLNEFDASKTRLLTSGIVPQVIVWLDNPVSSELKDILKKKNCISLLQKEVDTDKKVLLPQYSIYRGERRVGFFRLITWRTVKTGTSISGIWNKYNSKCKSIIMHRGLYLRDPYGFAIAFGLHNGMNIRKLTDVLPSLIVTPPQLNSDIT